MSHTKTMTLGFVPAFLIAVALLAGCSDDQDRVEFVSCTSAVDNTTIRSAEADYWSYGYNSGVFTAPNATFRGRPGDTCKIYWKPVKENK